METASPLVIGIPRALLYHRYGALWRGFFEGLGVKTVLSGPTSRQLLEEGANLRPRPPDTYAALLRELLTIGNKPDRVLGQRRQGHRRGGDHRGRRPCPAGMAHGKGRAVMAYDKIIPLRRRLDHCLDYVLNEEKTGLTAALAYAENPAKTQ